MTTTPDIPAVLVGPLIAVFITAVTYLATVGWTHPNHDQDQ